MVTIEVEQGKFEDISGKKGKGRGHHGK